MARGKRSQSWSGGMGKSITVSESRFEQLYDPRVPHFEPLLSG